jgi:predicted CoA-substrate-specific enzyme activase
MLKIGIDIGSTTIKAVATNKEGHMLYKSYVRHKSDITNALRTLLKQVHDVVENRSFYVNFTGSAALLFAETIGAQFTQEVMSATIGLRHYADDFDCAIELGGEDAKIIFFDGNNIEQRMNGTCAGGTGAFIDQMASLLHVDSSELNEIAKGYQRIYPIASRCGVFAKSDIQPLLNQGANHADIAVSIYQAIVNQTIAGLSQGRRIKGKVAFLGGPLTFASELRKRFVETLDLKDVFIPENGEVFVAFGASLNASETSFTMPDLIDKIALYEAVNKNKKKKTLGQLFKNKEEYSAFLERHNKHVIHETPLSTYKGNAYLGIDAGSTTTKMVLLSENHEILYYFYSHNQGNPIEMVKKALKELYQSKNDETHIKGSFSTGYGEELIKSAFHLDGSEVETICHYKAASYFLPDVEFIIDIGGQDMKCFKVEDGVISSIILNEACSSGCGSFLETFSTSLGYDIKDFASLALESLEPVDLGSRCTVFMNSGVKQAQAESASPSDISAGLAYSVVKNALYKVIRATDIKRELGSKIIVQGGTFYNNAVLRAFEKEIEMDVIRPNIAGLMGAFGAALLAKEQAVEESSLLSKQQLEEFSYRTKNATCTICENHCHLTVNIFKDSRYISGNRCERGAGIKTSKQELPNLYLYKYDRITSYKKDINPSQKTIGIPMVLNMYENTPFWFHFFDTLGYNVVYSDRSNKDLYELGQDSIPSDTACYPAKLVHGHIENLIQKDVDIIFYPNIPYNFLEKEHQDNQYNCPVVAFYPEVIGGNMDNLDLSKLHMPYVTLNSKKAFIQTIKKAFNGHLSHPKKDLAKAFDNGMQAFYDFRRDVLEKGEEAIAYALEHNKNLILLAGRPYHIDPEINHGIPKLLQSLGCVVVSEDSINTLADQEKVHVLNQWTYHTRLYDSAKYIANFKNANLIQLISFGCGLDAITSDEVKEILKRKNKLYTGIKIDEVNNLGTANIRIRSLLSTMKGDVEHG